MNASKTAKSFDDINYDGFRNDLVAKAYKRMCELVWSEEIAFSLTAYSAAVEYELTFPERAHLELVRIRAGKKNLLRAFK